MSEIKIHITRLHESAILPTYKRVGDAGFDLHACEDVLIVSHDVAVISTGLAFEIPEGFEMQIRMRSGAALKTPLIIANAPGTIDSGYRGEVGIIVRNLSDKDWLVRRGERLAQGVICPVYTATFVETANLSPSERGSNGFGSTGYC